MAKLLIYNPSNDMALASGQRQYMPPKQIQEMERRMAGFPETYADQDDVVLTDWNESYQQICQRAGKELTPAPWGWSLAIKQRLLKIGVPEALMPTDTELERWRLLSSRKTAAQYIQRLLQEFHTKEKEPALVGEEMSFYTTTDPVNQLHGNHIFKSPWSSSGRGVFTGTNTPRTIERLEGFLRKQGGFLADRYYDKILDCALEFEISPQGEVIFLGYSVFNTEGTGRYGNNFVESKGQLRRRILAAMGQSPLAESLLDRLVEYHKESLSEIFGGQYHGPVGIDMLVVNGETPDSPPRIHPCIEINLRMNMGIAAIKKYQKNVK